jgi:Rrf2 family protein
MLSLTRKTDYALVALARLAQQKTQGGQPLSARCIADEYDLPRQLLMSLLKSLHRAGLVESTRGVRGGYDLARPSHRISVADVVEAIEGSARLTPCCADEEPGEACTMCSITERCPITGAIRELNGQIADYLRTVSLDTLLKMEHGGKLPRLRRPMQLNVTR